MRSGRWHVYHLSHSHTNTHHHRHYPHCHQYHLHQCHLHSRTPNMHALAQAHAGAPGAAAREQHVRIQLVEGPLLELRPENLTRWSTRPSAEHLARVRSTVQLWRRLRCVRLLLLLLVLVSVSEIGRPCLELAGAESEWSERAIQRGITGWRADSANCGWMTGAPALLPPCAV